MTTIKRRNNGKHFSFSLFTASLLLAACPVHAYESEPNISSAKVASAKIRKRKRRAPLLSKNVLGDANNDGEFNTQDVELVGQHVSGQATAVTSKLADVAAPCDGNLDNLDAQRLNDALALILMPEFPKQLRSTSGCHNSQVIGEKLAKEKKRKIKHLRTFDTYPDRRLAARQR